MTVLVVIGGLQHHGNIRKKSAEDRAAGTLLGACIGLALILQQNLIGSLWLTYVLMSIVAGICAWYAIGKAGYIGLLTAITMCVVAGHGDNMIDTGLWRTLNVLIGIVIALAFSFALPLHATYSWRYLLADNLRGARGSTRASSAARRLTRMNRSRVFLELNARLVQLRALMPSVAKEIEVPAVETGRHSAADPPFGVECAGNHRRPALSYMRTPRHARHSRSNAGRRRARYGPCCWRRRAACVSAARSAFSSPRSCWRRAGRCARAAPRP